MLQNNSNPEKQVILLMISNEEGWCFLAVKKLLALLRGITSKRHGDFFVWIAFIFFATENARGSRKKSMWK